MIPNVSRPLLPMSIAKVSTEAIKPVPIPVLIIFNKYFLRTIKQGMLVARPSKSAVTHQNIFSEPAKRAPTAVPNKIKKPYKDILMKKSNNIKR